jgi:hypothetical protein
MRRFNSGFKRGTQTERFENMVLRISYGPMRNEMTGG